MIAALKRSLNSQVPIKLPCFFRLKQEFSLKCNVNNLLILSQ
jgi:hypothetical protein